MYVGLQLSLRDEIWQNDSKGVGDWFPLVMSSIGSLKPGHVMSDRRMMAVDEMVMIEVEVVPGRPVTRRGYRRVLQSVEDPGRSLSAFRRAWKMSIDGICPVQGSFDG